MYVYTFFFDWTKKICRYGDIGIVYVWITFFIVSPPRALVLGCLFENSRIACRKKDFGSEAEERCGAVMKIFSGAEQESDARNDD